MTLQSTDSDQNLPRDSTFARAMGMGVNNCVQSCARSFSQSRMRGQIQHVYRSGNPELTRTKQGWSHELKQQYVCHRQGDGLHLGKVDCECASVVHSIWSPFLSVYFHCFHDWQQPLGWRHRLASAKCSSSSCEWLGKAQTVKVSHLTLCVSVLYVLLTMVTCPINPCVYMWSIKGPMCPRETKQLIHI